MGVYNVRVIQKAIFKSNFYPKDRLVDFETTNLFIDFPLMQDRLAIMDYYHAQYIDSHLTETTDDIIDEDRQGGRDIDFGHSIGVIGYYSIKDLSNNIIQNTQPFNGDIQTPKTKLNPGQILFGNSAVSNPETRHYSVTEAGNLVSGALGSRYPYKILLPSVPDNTQKWKDLVITWNLNLRSVFNSGNWDLGDTGSQTFKVFQKSISVTKKFGGNILPNNSNYPITPTQTLKLDKSQNRGDGLISSWSILKKLNNNYVTATDSIDYSLVMGTLTSDQLEIQFLIVGDYRIVNYSKGNSSAQSGVNESYSILNINCTPDDITVNIDEYITFPKLNPIITPSLDINNVTIENVPVLKGYETYTVIVTPSLDLTNAYYKKVTTEINHSNNNSVTETEEIITLNDSQWLDLMLQKSSISCFIRYVNNSNIIESINCNTQNSYQAIFSQNDGNYEVGYLISPI